MMRGRAALATWFRGALAGVVAAALALGVAELVAGAIGRAVSPALVVGGAAVDRTPRFLKEFAIRTFGEHDKQVLLGGVFATIILIAAAIGVLATGRRRTGAALAAALGLFAAVVALTRPAAEPLDVLPSLVAAVVAGFALPFLLDRLTVPRVPRAGATTGPTETTTNTAPARRGVLVTGAVAVVAAASGLGGRWFQGVRTDVEASRRALKLPAPATPAPALPAGAQLEVDGISRFFTNPADFYRVDTALSVPRLTTDEWQLKVHGMVDKEITLSFDDLLKRTVVENDITLTCVSNEVGGPLMGTSRWLGVELAPLLTEAGLDPKADQLVGKSVDGMTIGTPISAVMDGRAAMLAIAMNGEPLLPEHGFPVRMIVPGLYGYVSATKWLIDLEVSTFAAYDPYWVKRGWKQEAPIKTSSRIDTPKAFARVKSGRVVVAGVAWAQHRGISAVEVRVDGGEWQKATLSQEVNTDLWRQWKLEWDAPSGSHMLQVRAVDATGEVQVEQRTPPFPSGSTGWQSVLVTVT